MTITGIRIRKISDDEKMKAVVSVTFDEALAVHDIKIIKGKERLFVAMPSKRLPDGHFADIVHPISADFREELEKQIIAEYQKTVEEMIRLEK